MRCDLCSPPSQDFQLLVGKKMLDAESKAVVYSSQILATSHDLGPQKVAEEGKWDPLFQENLGWWNIIPFGQIYDICIYIWKCRRDKDIKSSLHNWKLSCYFRPIKHVFVRCRHHRWILAFFTSTWCFGCGQNHGANHHGTEPTRYPQHLYQDLGPLKVGMIFFVGLDFLGFGWIVTDVSLLN